MSHKHIYNIGFFPQTYLLEVSRFRIWCCKGFGNTCVDAKVFFLTETGIAGKPKKFINLDLLGYQVTSRREGVVPMCTGKQGFLCNVTRLVNMPDVMITEVTYGYIKLDPHWEKTLTCYTDNWGTHLAQNQTSPLHHNSAVINKSPMFVFMGMYRKSGQSTGTSFSQIHWPHTWWHWDTWDELHKFTKSLLFTFLWMHFGYVTCATGWR